MSFAAKKVLRRLVLLERSCLEAALLIAATEPTVFEEREKMRVRAACGQALASLARAERELHGMATGKTGER